jgi:hypothetical protein
VVLDGTRPSAAFVSAVERYLFASASPGYVGVLIPLAVLGAEAARDPKVAMERATDWKQAILEELTPLIYIRTPGLLPHTEFAPLPRSQAWGYPHDGHEGPKPPHHLHWDPFDTVVLALTLHSTPGFAGAEHLVTPLVAALRKYRRPPGEYYGIYLPTGPRFPDGLSEAMRQDPAITRAIPVRHDAVTVTFANNWRLLHGAAAGAGPGTRYILWGGIRDVHHVFHVRVPYVPPHMEWALVEAARDADYDGFQLGRRKAARIGRAEALAVGRAAASPTARDAAPW